MAVSHKRVYLFLDRLAFNLKSGVGLRKALELDPDRSCVGCGRALAKIASGAGMDDVVGCFPIAKGEKAMLAMGFRHGFSEAALAMLSPVYRDASLRLMRIKSAFVYPIGILCIGFFIHAAQLALFQQSDWVASGVWVGKMIGATLGVSSLISFILDHRFLGLADALLWLPAGNRRRSHRRLRFLWTLHASLEKGAGFSEAIEAAAAADGRLSLMSKAERVIARVEAGEPLAPSLSALGQIAADFCWADSARTLAFAAKQSMQKEEFPAGNGSAAPSKLLRGFALLSLSPAYVPLIGQMVASTNEYFIYTFSNLR